MQDDDVLHQEHFRSFGNDDNLASGRWHVRVLGQLVLANHDEPPKEGGTVYDDYCCCCSAVPNCLKIPPVP